MGTPFENFINDEMPRRKVSLRGEGNPTMIATQGSEYIDTLTDNKWTKRGTAIDTNWVLESLGSAGAVGQGEQTLVEILDCESTMQVGQLVRLSEEFDDVVLTVNDNSIKSPVHGICIEKTGPTKAKIRFFGKTATTANDLIRGKLVFLQEDGTIGSSTPVTGVRQVLGVARSSSVIHFNPAMVISKRS